jgi:MoaA/NifB/PqqE/SkfB family radical SAM enzyme
VLLDDLQPSPSLWAPAPRFVSVALTNACDLRCSYCFAPKGPAELSVGQLWRWLRELDLGGCLGVGFGGGEPTLRSDLDQICGWCVEETGMSVTLTTHGHHFDARLADKLRGKVHFVRVSVDGHGAAYERLRGRPFTALLHALDAISTAAPFGVSVLVNSQSIGSLDPIADLAARRGAQEILLLPERPVRGSRGIDPHTASQLKQWVDGYSGPVRLATSLTAGVPDVPLAWPFARDEDDLTGYAHVSADGQLKRTSFDQVGVPINGMILACLTKLREGKVA